MNKAFGKDIQNEKIYTRLLNNYGYALLKTGDAIGLSYIIKSYNLCSEINDLPGIISSSKNLAEYYLETNDIEKSKEYFGIAYETSLNYDNEQEIIETLEFGLTFNLFEDPSYHIKESFTLVNSVEKRRQEFINYANTVHIDLNDAIEEKKRAIEEKKNVLINSLIISLLFISLLTFLFTRKFSKLNNQLLLELKMKQEALRKKEVLKRTVIENAKELNAKHNQLNILREEKKASEIQLIELEEEIIRLNEIAYKFKEEHLIKKEFVAILIQKIPALANKSKLIEFWALQHKGYTLHEMSEYFLDIEESALKDRASRLYKILREYFPHYKKINMKASKTIYNRLYNQYKEEKNNISTF